MRIIMHTYRLFARSAAAAALLLVTTAAADSRGLLAKSPCSSATCPPPAWAEEDPADDLYKAAREAMNANDFKKAAKLFGDLTEKYPKSAYAGDAYYWRAFSLYKLDGDDSLRDALRSIETQKTKFPKAKTAGDAQALAVRIRGTLAQRGDVDAAEKVSTQAQKSANCSEGRDDLRSDAINALLQMDPESAIPILKDILAKRDACSAWLRKKAVFMLSQKRTSETETLLMNTIRNDPSHDVRADAVFWLGNVRTEKAEGMLVDIATNGDTEMRKKAIFALTQQRMSRGQALIRKLAEDNSTPEEVRKDAIWQLGQNRSQENADLLRSLFGKVKNDADVANSVLFSLSQMRGFGNDRWLLALASDRSLSTEVRKHAIFCAGQAGISGSELVSLYDRITDREVKEHLIWVMSDARDRGGIDKLVDIAKNDKDVEMRKKALFWLGQKNDPRVRQLLIDIIKGE
jgi:TolA-binding protein